MREGKKKLDGRKVYSKIHKIDFLNEQNLLISFTFINEKKKGFIL